MTRGLRPVRGETAWVALSGGVDSAVAAALTLDAGCDVTGVTMRLGVEPSIDEAVVEAAASVCARLGIPHEVIDLSAEFRRRVVEPFIGAYMAGSTPNPCVLCNDVVKFGLLLDHARDRGAQWLVTGHYARTGRVDDRMRLLRGVDERKDQSYFLYRLVGPRLRELWFPLGGLTKSQVRAIAHERGLPAAGRSESQDVCFLGGRGMEGLMREMGHAPAGGDIVDTDGRVLGRHDGIWRFTVGQRKGLGIGGGTAYYVLSIDAEKDRVVVGPSSASGSDRIVVEGVVWDDPRGHVDAEVQVRYRSRPVRAVVDVDGPEMAVTLTEEVTGVAPGQSLVCYQENVVLGGGYIVGAS